MNFFFLIENLGRKVYRMQNMLLASYHREKNVTSFLFRGFFFFFFGVLLCGRSCMFPDDYFIFKNESPEMTWGFSSVLENYPNHWAYISERIQT